MKDRLKTSSPRILCVLLSCIPIWAGCDGAESAAADTEGTDKGPSSYILFQDANNYTFESTLYIPSVETAASADIEFCWDGLTRDFQCHEMDPAADIGNIGLVRVRNMTEQEIADALSRGDLPQSAADGYLDFKTDGDKTCANLANFSFGGSEVNIEEEYSVSDDRKYLIVVTSGTRPGVGARMMTFIHPSETSDVQSVSITADCDVLDFKADLTSLMPVKVPMRLPLEVDWSDINRNGQGGTVSFGGIDSVKLGFYEGMTPALLEAEVLDLFLIADKMWELELNGGYSADLAQAVDEDGNAFAGFEGEGTWVFTLTCSTCQNPAPQFVTIFEPTDGSDK